MCPSCVTGREAQILYLCQPLHICKHRSSRTQSLIDRQTQTPNINQLRKLQPQSPHSGAVAKLHPQRRFVPQQIRLLLRPATTLHTQLHVEMPHHSCQYRPHLKIRKAKLAEMLSMSSTITAGESPNLLFAKTIPRSYRKRLECIFAIVTVTFGRLW